MSCYNHLTTEERECILVFLAKGYSKRKIAEELHRSPSTISRELKRNKTYKVQLRYSPEQASLKYKNRRKHCHRQLRLKEPETYALVVSLLQRFWSPEQINHRLKLEQSQIQIGTSTIYGANQSSAKAGTKSDSDWRQYDLSGIQAEAVSQGNADLPSHKALS